MKGPKDDQDLIPTLHRARSLVKIPATHHALELFIGEVRIFVVSQSVGMVAGVVTLDVVTGVVTT